MSRPPLGTSTLAVRVVGVSGVRRALAKVMEPEMTRALDVANKRAAQSLAKGVRADVRRYSRRAARAVRVRRARTGRPGWVVGSRRSGGGFVFPFVVGGTRDHGPRKARAIVFQGRSGLVVTRRVRGVAASDSVERAARAGEKAAALAAEQSFASQAGL